MFTGIVEEIGRVLEIVGDQERDNFLTIASQVAREGARLGDSIAINGTCLTVTALATDQFRVGLSPETLRRTNLGRLQVGDPLNLERSLTFGGRMGGHYVQGHVDGVGTIVAVVPEGDAKRIRIQPPAQLLPYIVEKGYIAVDGASLTVAELDDRAVGEVQAALEANDLAEARRLLSWHLVSRPTSDLRTDEVAAATIESLAENLSDSLVAPSLAYLLGGLSGIAVYRLTNTADAM
ncbi:riboflavin synthase [Candidatus Chloroploca sp. M-50]|uniref:Riboflavin synthase n=1 Tax=Candidatus Chloroploca mongolica TaxID=2528176 RepID=A0ABS4D3Z6_9CHLR|nr:riboflavin synthase [Candidatus Chloroploca mongolica]